MSDARPGLTFLCASSSHGGKNRNLKRKKKDSSRRGSSVDPCTKGRQSRIRLTGSAFRAPRLDDTDSGVKGRGDATGSGAASFLDKRYFKLMRFPG